MSTQTPWGQSDYKKVYATGIIFYGTPSHGGFHLSETRVSVMDKELQKTFGDLRGWYEEDCDWALVVIAYPEFFSYEEYSQAFDSIKFSHPNIHKRICSGENLKVNPDAERICQTIGA